MADAAAAVVAMNLRRDGRLESLPPRLHASNELGSRGLGFVVMISSPFACKSKQVL